MLLAQGAVPALSPEVILDYFELEGRIDGGKEDASVGDEKEGELEGADLVLHALDQADPISYEELIQKTGLSEEELTHNLLILELEGKIVQPSRQSYLKKYRI